MVHVLVRHKVADYDKWRALYDSDGDAHKAAGEKGCQVFRNHADPSEVVLLFEWESAEKLNEVMGSDHLKEKMAEAGVTSPPEVLMLDKA